MIKKRSLAIDSGVISSIPNEMSISIYQPSFFARLEGCTIMNSKIQKKW